MEFRFRCLQESSVFLWVASLLISKKKAAILDVSVKSFKQQLEARIYDSEEPRSRQAKRKCTNKILFGLVLQIRQNKKKLEYCFLTNKKLFSIKLILINQVHGKTKKKNDSEEVIQGCSVKNGVLKNEACNFIKKSLWHKVFSCEFCEIFKNNYFYRTPLGGYF